MAVQFGSKTRGALGFPYNTGPSLAAGSALPPLPGNTQHQHTPAAARCVLRGTSTAAPPSLRAPVVVCLLCWSGQSVSSNSEWQLTRRPAVEGGVLRYGQFPRASSV